MLKRGNWTGPPMETPHRRRRQAALKAAETKGPTGLRDAALKTVETKGATETSHAAKMAAWTRAHGKNDAANSYSKMDANPRPMWDS
jgi:hypothetical protein